MGGWVRARGEVSLCALSGGSDKAHTIWLQVARVFEAHSEHIVELCVSDQEYLEMMVLNADLMQEVWPGQVREYKSECSVCVPPNTAIVTFPLVPKPHNYPSPWIAELWVE